MFVHNNMVTATPCEPGVSRKVMAYNDQVMMCEITFEKGAKGNFHTHPHVQTTYIARGGQFRLRKEKQPHECQGYHQKGNDRYDNC